MKKLLFSVAIVAMTMLVMTRIHRGTNLSHWLSQSEERGEARQKHIQEDDFARLEELGFDFVRIPIDEVQFWDENGNKHGNYLPMPLTGLVSTISALLLTCTSFALIILMLSMREAIRLIRSSPQRKLSKISLICGNSCLRHYMNTATTG